MKALLNFFVLLCLVGFSPTFDLFSMMKESDFEDQRAFTSRKKANSELPLRDEAYTYEELMEKFHPYLKGNNVKFYESSLKLMFLYFPDPKHPVKTIISGWQCLLGKLIEAEGHIEAEDLDKNALLDVLALHKKTLEQLDPELFKIVSEHAPCPNCVASAKTRALDGQ